MVYVAYITRVWGGVKDWYVEQLGDELRLGFKNTTAAILGKRDDKDFEVAVSVMDDGGYKQINFTWADLSEIRDIKAEYPVNVQAEKGDYGPVAELVIKDNNRTMVFGNRMVRLYEDYGMGVRSVQMYLGSFCYRCE